MLILTQASLATVNELFRYKANNFSLRPFPGYSDDQWGIKAHNRPWVAETVNLTQGMKVIEVGGAYSTLPRFLAEQYSVEAWVGDDFGIEDDETLWSRWGDPRRLPELHPQVTYIYERFGKFSLSYPDEYFDCIFSVSTLEHVPYSERESVINDMHRCLRPGGIQLHTIDIGVGSPRDVILDAVVEKCPWIQKVIKRRPSEISAWVTLLQHTGVTIQANIPSSLKLLDRSILVESPDVVYRFYPPNNAPKSYNPSASFLMVIEKRK